MIDIHNHILPNMDDGASSLKESIEMAKDAVKQGIHTIVATPHHKNGIYENDRDIVIQTVDFFQKVLQEQQIPLTICTGQEIRINGDLLQDLENDELLTVNKTKYILIEFPTSTIPYYAKQMLYNIQLAGFIPVIAHPERNDKFREHPELLYEFVRCGSLTQITAGSIVGKFGRGIQKFASQLIKANLTHFIASDAHNTTTRRICLYEAYDIVKNMFGFGTAYMLRENSYLLVDGMNVNRLDPELINKRKFLGLF